MSYTLLPATLLLTASNVFMTFARHEHLKNMSHSPWYIAALISWSRALFKYLLQVPANSVEFTEELSLGQQKTQPQSIPISVFVPFTVPCMGQPLKPDCLCTALSLLSAVFFIFRT